MRLLVIPARGGSKRIPRKNIKQFAGRPIIAWAIEAATQSGAFDEIVVSTDDDEVAQVARDWGASVPFMRQSQLANDHTGTRAVVTDAIERLSPTEGFTCCLYATAPFVTSADLRTAAELLSTARQVDTIVSVIRVDSSLLRSFAVADGRLVRLLPEYASARSQDLPPVYRDAGQFYLARNARWRDPHTSITHQALPYELPAERTVDIDTPEDWQRAEAAFLQWTDGGTRELSQSSGPSGSDTQ